jgi:splicing factor 3B subunit 3
MAEEMVEAAGEEEQELAAEMAAAFLNEKLPEEVFGSPKAGWGMWASQVRLQDPITGKTLTTVELEQNEAALSATFCKFASRGDVMKFLVIGTAKDYQLQTRTCSGGYLQVYIVSGEAGDQLEFLHKTAIDDIPGAMTPFNGKLLVGVGPLLRVYELGKKKLLRKCESKSIPNFIVKIDTIGLRIIVSDVQESFHFLRYRPKENSLSVFADDTNPRWLTTAAVMDYDTIAGADKFGNICLVRLPSDCTDDLESEDPTGNKAFWEKGVLSGASQKSEVLVNFHVGEVISSLQKATLIPGGSESLVYTTLSGSIGMLVPFTSHEDHDFFQHLEMHLRGEHPPLCGRDHLSYRSYYFPVKNVIDGDLCEQYNSLDLNKQKSIAEDLDRTPAEVSKKLEDIRTRFAF